MMRLWLFALIALLLAADGYVHGLWTGRWQTAHELDAAAARLSAVPMDIGDWHGEARSLPARHVEVAGFRAYLARRYQHRKDGSTVDVLLACGPPGPLSVHTPEVCFVGAGFEPEERPAPETIARPGSAPGAEFWKAKYGKTHVAVPEHLRVFWSWHAQGAWQIPANPRWTFAGLPVIHKMYVTCPLQGTKDDSDNGACASFMTVFLPALDNALFSSGGTP